MTAAAKGGGRPRAVPLRFKYLLLLTTIFGGCLILVTFNSRIEMFIMNTDPSWSHRYEIRDSEESYTIRTEGCTIPGLRAFDESIKKFSEPPKKFERCHNANNSLLKSNETHIWIVKENLPHYKLSINESITCCYKWFYRPAAIVDIKSADVDDRVQYGKCVEFDNSIEAINEFVKVSCRHTYKTIYEQFFLFTSKKPLITSISEDSIETIQNQSGGYNVIVMGIDAISRLNFHRTMPKTLAYLKKKGGLEFLGYNKVGDNTFPNLIPMLLGIKDTELKKTCWPNTKSTFDNCPFIWDWYKDAGYYTAFGEDSARLGTFNYEKLGFAASPTDYYIHTFMYEAEIHVGNKKDFNAFICMGDKYFYKVLLDYIESLTRTLKNDKLFGFFWEVTMSHDYLNYPMLMDDDYEQFLKHLDDSNYLDDTILILLSDHGIRWGEIRYTKQGRLEERLPLFQILIPRSFQDNFPLAYENIKNNRKRLTTPFDLHATLSDLTNLNFIKDEQITLRSKENYGSDRSISLFLPIPNNRTCNTAAIDDHWCTCHKSNRISINNKDVYEPAFELVRNLNLLLQDHSQCVKLKLSEILEATEMDAGVPEVGEVGWQEIMLVVRTTPGGGVFEATLRRNSKQEWSLAGTVSRLNLYGDQSRCVHHYQLKLYCFCNF
ncbi:uncharacterized protein LOC114250150 [Bombyx mandarina]|uniref:Uncharacterized protein LOC114250150 n=1 Tax=Bombyx mandarina TaxID=7092 RepID=A0A6J2KBP1_BOMMA|nr:uncharacterized protein LOC114250150 [Bombyx mandarina]